MANLWTLLTELALAATAGFFLLDAFAPPQDLPWKPLDLNAPIGRATGAKISSLEPARTASSQQVEAATDTCMALLRDAGVLVERARDQDDGGFCVVRGAVRIRGGDVTPLSPGGVVMQCPLAVRYVIWDRQVLRPEAQDIFGSDVSRVDNLGTYACRRIYGSSRVNDRPSQHARANAIDVAGVALEDGRRVTLAGDWDGRGAAGGEGARFLRRLSDGACRVFSTVLGPDYNAAHADHFHFDGAPRGICR